MAEAAISHSPLRRPTYLAQASTHELQRVATANRARAHAHMEAVSGYGRYDTAVAIFSWNSCGVKRSSACKGSAQRAACSHACGLETWAGRTAGRGCPSRATRHAREGDIKAVDEARIGAHKCGACARRNRAGDARERSYCTATCSAPPHPRGATGAGKMRTRQRKGLLKAGRVP